jgi:[ribosomal protein S5]-alanine N-acetyltransferase
MSNSRQLVFPDSLRDEAISLHAWSVADLPAIQEASNDEAITRITAVPTPYSRDAAIAFIRARHEAADNGSALSMAIHSQLTEATLGGINLNSFDWTQACARAGYWIIPSARGRRTAARALTLITSWALTSLGLRLLVLHIDPDNEASLKAAVAAGYQYAGPVRAAVFGDDQPADMLRYLRDA